MTSSGKTADREGKARNAKAVLLPTSTVAAVCTSIHALFVAHLHPQSASTALQQDFTDLKQNVL